MRKLLLALCLLVALAGKVQAQGAQILYSTNITGTVTITGPDVSYSLSQHSLAVVVNVTSITGTTPTITPVVQFKDIPTGQYIQWHAAFTAISTAGTTTYLFCSGCGAAAGGITAVAAFPYPGVTWRLVLTYGGTVTATAGTATVYGLP